MRLKRYAIKKGTKEKDIIQASGVEEKDYYRVMHYVTIGNSDILIDIYFPSKISEWDDWNNVTVMDTDADKLYMPFYKARAIDGEIDTEAEITIAEEYNKFMDSLPFLKAKKA